MCADRQLEAQITENKQILQHIVRGVLYLAKQGVALRGDPESLEGDKNPGNFLALAKVFSENDSSLRQHLNRPRMRNATYLSPESQNDIIEVLGFDIAHGDLVEEVKQAKFFCVLADEVFPS